MSNLGESLERYGRRGKLLGRISGEKYWDGEVQETVKQNQIHLMTGRQNIHRV